MAGVLSANLIIGIVLQCEESYLEVLYRNDNISTEQLVQLCKTTQVHSSMIEDHCSWGELSNIQHQILETILPLG